MLSLAGHPQIFPVTNLAERTDPLSSVARAAARGDERATRVLLSSLGAPVFAVVGAVLGRGNADVDDVVQEAFVAILDALPEFRFESSVVHFARCIAVRRASVALRHRKAAKRSAAATVPLGEEVAAGEASPLDAMIGSRQMNLLRDLIAALPGEQAESLLLVVLGHSVEEVAEATRTPLNTVRSRLRAARATLRERIASEPRLAELGSEPAEEP